ncbi:hypothetical protein ASPCAL12847 [Aspergillus calidoustus]|uniref:Uncharacterized protein n=1 Tax=Aspergillus calidoustus TaxID=454130 RepID=A0A0U5GBM3_ASPCI|nr:hypothetical protein ASPCAL12847 [Aspergillus calidoustus]
MEQVRKTFFDPLATTKSRIREILQDLPVGSAHPFSPERLLLVRTANGINEIDTSSYPEDYFFNAVDLGEMGETLLRRMAGFQSHLGVFEDFHIMQAPAPTFKIPIVSGQITIFAVSERTPTYYDFCFADAECNTCCFAAENTFRGISHSGDITNGPDFLAHVKLDQQTLTEEKICVFISGYNYTRITEFLGTHPALLVADHVDKALYLIPVPLDAATIGAATICCPMVIQKDGDSLVCSILPMATTDVEKMCSGSTLNSDSFKEAIERADFTLSAPPRPGQSGQLLGADMSDTLQSRAASSESLYNVTREHAVIATAGSTNLPSFLKLHTTQMVRFGTGIEFQRPDEETTTTKPDPSAVVLPCIFGAQLEGPILLATGTVPCNVPFTDELALREYYKQLESAMVIVDERMTDNARNLATAYRINALFIVQLSPEDTPTNTEEVLSLLNAANINAVTALAGPQSLVVVQVGEKYYFYRGIANRAYVNTSRLEFGADVTSILESVSAESILDPRIEQIVTLGETDSVLLPSSGQRVRFQDLERLFEDLSIDQLHSLEDDISAAVPQLQVLMNQKDLQALSKTLVSTLSAKISDAIAPLRISYTEFLKEYNRADPEAVKAKNNMLGQLRKTTKEMQVALEPLISSLANMISAQTTSKRTHDLKRLVRQAQIQGNVEAVKSMTFETLAGYLETYAADMGVMLLNIQTRPYSRLLADLNNNRPPDASLCCTLDPRVLHLEGFDAGIIIEQSQGHHDGPLVSQSGPSHPILALPYLSQESGTGSMLAWVCWDEFVNLESPYTVRWMEKCNDAHIAALRIIMRSTLSQAVASREHHLQPNSLETGKLMSALLMSAMSKLAAMRNTTPVESTQATDTVTRLMRGLFGNLLTIAGSGVRPLSMVWQLFGLNSQNDLPKTDADWIWYETVVALYPYTGWPRKQFYENLERLLDKAIIHVVTTNEDLASVRATKAAEMIKFCKLRNIQLFHSRSIITVLMRMLTAKDGDAGFDVPAVAARLLEQLPRKLEKQSSGYSRMRQYLEHLAAGGERRFMDDLIVASTYTARSAAFGELKTQVAEAFNSDDWAKVKSLCQEIMDKQAALASLWRVKPGMLKVQNKKVYDELLTTDFDQEIDEDNTKSEKLLLFRKKILADAEMSRVPWQVGKNGEFGESIEPLDEGFVHEMLTGETTMADEPPTALVDSGPATLPETKPKPEDGFAPFKSLVRSSFITTMQKSLSAEDVCRIMNVSASAMRVFVSALNPDFVWEDLGENFRGVILGLLRERSNREGSCPAARLLEFEEYKNTLKIQVFDISNYPLPT